MDKNFYYNFPKPPIALENFVESIGMFHNPTEETKEVVVMPDGRVDLFLFQSETEPFYILLLGLETLPEQRSILPHTLAFVISFKPLALEYILQRSIADLVNTAQVLPEHFWDFKQADLQDFDAFYLKATEIITALLPSKIDERKQKLFDFIYASNGKRSVKDLSDEVGWSSRQINRYFNQQFGLSLKAFCNILRFRASLEHIAIGNLYPNLNFSDQTHFVKEIKKFAGVVPKELSKNKNDRFILLSVLKQK